MCAFSSIFIYLRMKLWHKKRERGILKKGELKSGHHLCFFSPLSSPQMRLCQSLLAALREREVKNEEIFFVRETQKGLDAHTHTHRRRRKLPGFNIRQKKFKDSHSSLYYFFAREVSLWSARTRKLDSFTFSLFLFCVTLGSHACKDLSHRTNWNLEEARQAENIQWEGGAQWIFFLELKRGEILIEFWRQCKGNFSQQFEGNLNLVHLYLFARLSLLQW